MSKPNRDEHGRRRSITVAFRVSDEEKAILNRMVALSGLTKQDYITRRLMERDVVVYGNPRVHLSLKNEMSRIHDELKRLSCAEEISYELQEIIKAVAQIYEGMQTAGRST